MTSEAGLSMKRFYELDLLRFIAAFSVLLFHYTFRGHAADNLSDLDYGFITPITKYGYLGVDLFFLISGFVILMTAASGSRSQFVASRIVRLYPAFWLCCTVTFLVMLSLPQRRHVPTPGEYAANLTMLNGFANIPYVDNVYWSLKVEMKFYFLVFLVLLVRQIHRARLLFGLWLIGYIVCKVWPIRFVTGLLIPDFAPYFIAGAMFYLVSREGLDLYKGFIITVCWGLIVGQGIRGLVELRSNYHANFSPIVVGVALTLFFVLFYLISTGRTASLASKRVLALGALTYPLYLVHQNVGFSIFNSGLPHLNRHVLLASVTALMLAVAWLVNQAEKKCSRPLKDFLLRVFSLAGARRAESARASSPPPP
jgi:peptidoglycan/LPS O-acetylase OafA/YrhL